MTHLNRKRKIIITVIAIIALITTLTLTLVFTLNKKKIDSHDAIATEAEFQNVNYGVNYLKTHILNSFSIIPISEEDRVDIFSEGEIVVTYKKYYVIESLIRAKLVIETIYMNDEKCELNSREDFYLNNGFIHMKRTDKDGENISKYEGNIRNFKELVRDGANDYYSYDYNPRFIEEYRYSIINGERKMQMKVKDENIKDFLGSDELPISNMIYDFVFFQNGNIKNNHFSYDTIKNGKSFQIKTSSSIFLDTQIVIPDWAQEEITNDKNQ